MCVYVHAHTHIHICTPVPNKNAGTRAALPRSLVCMIAEGGWPERKSEGKNYIKKKLKDKNMKHK